MSIRHALIVGGGPAGAAAALAFAQDGVPHSLIERDADGHDALCGGFLSWRSLAMLGRFGIAPDTLNAQPITTLRIVAGTRIAEAMLPHPACCVSRRRLDPLLRARATAAGARIETGTAARGWAAGVLRTDDGAEVASGALLLATGKAELRGLARPAAARGIDPALGLRVRLPPSPVLDRLVADRIELHLFDRGYAGIARQEDGSVNLCMAVRRSRLTAAGSPAALLAALAEEAPLLGERLALAEATPAVDAVANVPYGWRARAMEPGVFRVGDQAAVIPSLAGEGMAIALASGFLAARVYRDAGAAGTPHYPMALVRLVARPMRVAGVIRAAAERGWSAQALVAAVRVAPGLAGVVAHLTRIRT